VTEAGLPDRSPEPISHMELVDWLEDPLRSRALVTWNINIAASNPRQARLRRALGRADLFTVAIDIFPTDTADLADVVLPAATFLESDDLVTSYFHLSLSAQVKAADPPGDALPNTEIFRRLARAMGMTEPALYESDRDVIDHLLAGTDLGLGFEELAARGTAWCPAEPQIQFADLRFPTPSGRVELASARAEHDGHTRLAQPSADPRPTAGRLRLLTPASPWTLNDSYANEPKLAGRRGPATVTMHPQDARERGLADGDIAVLRSDTGELALEVATSPDVPPGVAVSPKGRWPRQESGGANVNVLNPGTPADMGASTSVHGVEVTVEPLRGPRTPLTRTAAAALQLGIAGEA
jgi:anaerobic selenocysteine-containing dehydrogenase